MKSLYESILSSTNSGKFAYLKKIMESTLLNNFHTEKLPGHAKESIIVDAQDSTWTSILHFENCSKEALSVLKAYDGIIFSLKKGLRYPPHIYFGNIENCAIDLSCLDFTDKTIGGHTSTETTEIRFTDCTNISIDKLPVVNTNDSLSGKLVLWNTSLSNITKDGTNTMFLENMQLNGKKPKIITDFSVFKDCNFKYISFTENYFECKNSSAYMLNRNCITDKYSSKYVMNYFNEYLDEIVENNIVQRKNKANLNISILTTYSFKKLAFSDNKNYKYMLKQV